MARTGMLFPCVRLVLFLLPAMVHAAADVRGAPQVGKLGSRNPSILGSQVSKSMMVPGPLDTPLGCFADSKSDRVLTHPKLGSQVMTPTVCSYYCAGLDEDYAYYATQYGRECWCAKAGIHYSRHGPGLCNYPCTGLPDVMCGGFNAFTLYELNVGVRPTPPQSFQYLGCFRDSKRDRLLATRTTSSTLTPKSCADICSKIHLPYFGLQYGKECWCGGCDVEKGDSKYDRYGSANCDMTCTGNPLVECGGYDAMNMYRMYSCGKGDGDVPSPTPVPTAPPTRFQLPPPPTLAPSNECSLCELEVGDMSAPVTMIGGTRVVISATCDISTTVMVDVGDAQPLEIVGEAIHPNTVVIVTPPFDSDESALLVTTLPGGLKYPLRIPVSRIADLSWMTLPASIVGATPAGSRGGVITTPPMDLEVVWDASLISSATVDILLITTSDGTLKILATLGTGEANDGTFTVKADVLVTIDEVDDALVLVKIQASALEGIPEALTTKLIKWADVPITDVGQCEDLFDDNDSRCQCFFSVESKSDGGVPVTDFAQAFRCPAYISCAVGDTEAPSCESGTPADYLYAFDLAYPWESDGTCPFAGCAWSLEYETTTNPPNMGIPSCSFNPRPFFCNAHEGAAFCIRTVDAEGPGGSPNGHANQCCYDSQGYLLLDITKGGGTTDRVATGSLLPGSLAAHLEQDVHPFHWCCDDIDSWQCRRYTEMRPTDAGDDHQVCPVDDPDGSLMEKDVTIKITLPTFPVKIDFGLLVDVTSSYMDDLPAIKTLAPNLVDELLVDEDGDERLLRLALGTFSDFPEPPFGGSGDYPYRQEKAFSSCLGEADEDACEKDRQAFLDAVSDIEIAAGGDLPESQSIALHSAASTWQWAEGVTKILALTTDAPFHTPDDDPRYQSLEDIIAVCASKNIKVVGIEGPGAGDELDKLANATGGSVQTTDSTSSQIVDAVLEGIAQSTFGVVEVKWACRDTYGAVGWEHTDGLMETDVSGGAEIEFTVNIKVPADVSAGLKCVALVLADEVLVGGKEFVPTLTGITDAEIEL